MTVTLPYPTLGDGLSPAEAIFLPFGQRASGKIEGGTYVYFSGPAQDGLVGSHGRGGPRSGRFMWPASLSRGRFIGLVGSCGIGGPLTIMPSLQSWLVAQLHSIRAILG